MTNGLARPTEAARAGSSPPGPASAALFPPVRGRCTRRGAPLVGSGPGEEGGDVCASLAEGAVWAGPRGWRRGGRKKDAAGRSCGGGGGGCRGSGSRVAPSLRLPASRGFLSPGAAPKAGGWRARLECGG